MSVVTRSRFNIELDSKRLSNNYLPFLGQSKRAQLECRALALWRLRVMVEEERALNGAAWSQCVAECCQQPLNNFQKDRVHAKLV